MIWPPYECPTTIVGPSWNSSTWRSRATSSASEVSGNCGARTWKPSAWRRSMTPLQLDPSAQAPWTRTTFGRPFTSTTPSVELWGQCAQARRRCASHDPAIRKRALPLGYARREGRMQTVPVREFHGRDAELALVRSELDRLSDGAEAVIVIEGAAGMGKSRLLAEVAAIAGSLGIRVGRSAADPSETMVELAALLAALFDGTEPLLDPGALTTLRAQPEQRFWLLRDLQQLLEPAALESPLLISIDDAHWADAGTVAAIRTLPMRLMGLPIAWVIALRPPREATPLVHALEHLKQEGARSIVLGPLDDDAVVQLAADILGAQPDQSILKQLAEADGSPFLVVETLLGLQEEERIRVVDGRARMIDDRLPRRVQEKMRERLGRLSDEASDAVTVAASLGRRFTFDQLARTLGRPASDLLAPVDELLEANLLVERDEHLAFWHDITREAVRTSVPVTARRALDRQAAVVLLEAGALPVEVAVQLAASAEPGDEVAINTLLRAAKA